MRELRGEEDGNPIGIPQTELLATKGAVPGGCMEEAGLRNDDRRGPSAYPMALHVGTINTPSQVPVLVPEH